MALLSVSPPSTEQTRVATEQASPAPLLRLHIISADPLAQELARCLQTMPDVQTARRRLEELACFLENPRGLSLSEPLLERHLMALHSSAAMPIAVATIRQIACNALMLREQDQLRTRIGEISARMEGLAPAASEALRRCRENATREDAEDGAEAQRRLDQLERIRAGTEAEVKTRLRLKRAREEEAAAELQRQAETARATASQAGTSVDESARAAAAEASRLRLEMVFQEWAHAGTTNEQREQNSAADRARRAELARAEQQLKTVEDEAAAVQAAIAARAPQLATLQRDSGGVHRRAAALPPARVVSATDGSGMPSWNGNTCVVA